MIEAFYQFTIQQTSSPEHARSYPAYMRAIPLLTEEDLKSEKDTPIIDVEKARYHVGFAIRHPYMLIPVPEKKSPFPAVKKYAPGDKFKANYLDDTWHLVETFAGEGISKGRK
jgi:hypothetical protein